MFENDSLPLLGFKGMQIRWWAFARCSYVEGDRGAQRPITIGTNVEIPTEILVDCRIFEKIGAWKFSFQTTVPTPIGAFLSPKSNVTGSEARPSSTAGSRWTYPRRE